MANRNIKGVLTRNSWDFYEYGTAWAIAYQLIEGPQNLFALLNPGTQQANLDVYRTEYSQENAQAFYWYAFQFTTPIPAQQASPASINCCETNQPTPMGIVGFWSTPWFSGGTLIRARADKPLYDCMELRSGGPFITLAPNWGIGLITIGNAPPSNSGSASFWYQVIADQVSQVR